MDEKKVITWNEYFMAIAYLSSKRSKDPNTQVGCCIVDEDNKIISVGYNGFPKIKREYTTPYESYNRNNDVIFPWCKDKESSYDNKYNYVVHAELNAILNSHGSSLKNAIMYVTEYPCCECAKAIIQSGIVKIYYASNKYKDSDSVRSSMRMLEEAGIICEQYVHSQNNVITINI